jgi:hypothetical protein
VDRLLPDLEAGVRREGGAGGGRGARGASFGVFLFVEEGREASENERERARASEQERARASERGSNDRGRRRKKTHFLLNSLDHHRHQDRAPTLDDMPKLRWTTRVINESMRLYPQPPVLIRRAAVDTKLVRMGFCFFLQICF